MPEFDRAWQSWLSENIQRGCAPESVVDAMVAAGFDQATATGALVQLLQFLQPSPPAIAASGYHYDPMPIAAGNRIDVGDREVAVLMRCERPQIVVFGNVLSDAECDELMRRSRDKLQRSTIVNPVTGAADVIAQRSSEGTHYQRCEDDFIAALDRRVARLMNWPLENGEGFQILRYGVGGEYESHYDYHSPHDSGSLAHLAAGGQRVSTMVMYLNDVDEGGETIFPDAGMAVAPKKGGAAYFRYCNELGQVDPLTLHAGAPVRAGEKWIMTKWMRQRAYESSPVTRELAS